MPLRRAHHVQLELDNQRFEETGQHRAVSEAPSRAAAGVDQPFLAD